jgi:two-component system, NarL family, nitrate/nitrite response regulator NarL
MELEASSVGGAPSVALLEEQRVLRESLAALLQARGVPVRAVCASADQFRMVVESVRPNVAILDVYGGGPDEPRWDMVQFLRHWHPEVKVLVLAQGRSPADVERSHREGLAGYLWKQSVGPDQLIEAIHRVARGERLFPLTEELRLEPGLHVAAPNELRVVTGRELDVLRHVAAGHDNLKIAACLGITERTARAHVSNLYRKLGSENRAQLALLARRLGVHPANE